MAQRTGAAIVRRPIQRSAACSKPPASTAQPRCPTKVSWLHSDTAGWAKSYGRCSGRTSFPGEDADAMRAAPDT